MNIFALDIFEEYECCTIYTVHQFDEDGEKMMSETERFFRKYYADENYRSEISELIELLQYIGEKRGANKYLFRPEGKADGLPKNEKQACKELKMDYADFPLRLYCLRINDEILVLFNGGIKDAQTAQESQASMSFYEAQQYCERIQQAINEKEIWVSDRYLEADTENIEL